MSHIAYTTDQLDEQPVLQLLAELGRQVSNARDMAQVERSAPFVYQRQFQICYHTRDPLLPCLLAGQLDLGE